MKDTANPAKPPNECPDCGRLNTERYGENPPKKCVWCRNGY